MSGHTLTNVRVCVCVYHAHYIGDVITPVQSSPAVVQQTSRVWWPPVRVTKSERMPVRVPAMEYQAMLCHLRVVCM